MAGDGVSHSEHLPAVLLISKPPAVFLRFRERFATKFLILSAIDSPLPLPQFLSEHGRVARALLVSATTSVSEEILRLLPSLKLIVTTSAGLDHIDLPECRRRGISVAGAADLFSEDVADIAVGMAIDVLRSVSAADRYVRRGFWSANGDYPLGSRLHGKKVGIVGLGSIGMQVAKRLEAFNCSISYTSRNTHHSVPYPFYPNPQTLAANSDILVLCCALTPETHHIIDKSVLSALGKQGIVINIARGAIIDEKELVQRLVDKEIGGAGLDVFEQEPDVPTELLTLDNVVLSPHFAVFTEESLEDLAGVVIGNLEAFFSNRPLMTQVI